MRHFTAILVRMGLLGLACAACSGEVAAVKKEAPALASRETDPDLEDKSVVGSRRVFEAPPEQDIYRFAGGCYILRDEGGHWLSRTGLAGQRYRFVARSRSEAAAFFMKATDLGTYLFYDQDRGYVTSGGAILLRKTRLESDVSTQNDRYLSDAEWVLREGPARDGRYVLRHLRTGRSLSRDGVLDPSSAAVIELEEATGCAEHPELSLDAEGAIGRTTFDDGDLFGIADTHSHLLSNFGFGGGGLFHGSTFHPLGVEHALPDCEKFHGEDGRKDLMGYVFDHLDKGGADQAEIIKTLASVMVTRRLSEFNHRTRGYPHFDDWPNAPTSSTHQTQYYLWLERAWLAGLRLVVQHATTNSVICALSTAPFAQKQRYGCNDMVAVDRILEETYAMERYIDAQAGGPGRGFFRIVKSPAAAREVIRRGKMAVILGIETSNLFDCFLSPGLTSPKCDEAYVARKLDEYYELGVRAMFPVHKWDNAFAPGDGHRGFLEAGNFLNSGHYNNFVADDCPDVGVFDSGDVDLAGLNRPREKYDAPPPVNTQLFEWFPYATLAPHVPKVVTGGSLKGNYCNKAGLTPLGESLVEGMMKRGMILEIDHLPRRAYARVFEMMQAHGYPAAGTHGGDNRGKLYALGGISKSEPAECRDLSRPGQMLSPILSRVSRIREQGGYPAVGLGLDLNGFAGAPRARFGAGSRCKQPQVDPVTYPFRSYAGDITFSEPRLGERIIDYPTEGFVHIGMLPEFLDDARRDAADEADMEPLFRSAEGYIRMWELAEARAQGLGDAPQPEPRQCFARCTAMKRPAACRFTARCADQGGACGWSCP